MTSIEKSTMKTTTAAILIASLMSSTVAGLTVYFSSVNGTKEGFNQLRYETNIKFNNLENADKLMQRDINELQGQTYRLEQAAMSYIGPAGITQLRKNK